jgi:predicted Zn-dependent protease
MPRFLLFLWISSLFFATCFISFSGTLAQVEDKYSLQLQGFVWNHTTLNVLVVTSNNESWWSNVYLNTALRAIGQWNQAIVAFASNYSDFSYLSSLVILPTVSNTSETGFDIYVEWTTSPFSNSTDEIGLSQISTNYQSTINNCTVMLAAHTHHGDSLNEEDMQNVALHELGHSLGLGHSNYTGDLMNAYYTRGSPLEKVSTLDVYGVATLFAWKTGNVSFYPVSRWLNETSALLPSEIAYRGFPVSPENAVPQTFANSSVGQTLILMFEILIHPEIFVIVIFFIFVLVSVALLARRKRG